MVGGDTLLDRDAPQSRDTGETRLLALVVLVVCAGAGSLAGQPGRLSVEARLDEPEGAKLECSPQPTARACKP
jgi:hypothetical protein